MIWLEMMIYLIYKRFMCWPVPEMHTSTDMYSAKISIQQHGL